MSYQALYRKYRPADFSGVKGQDHIVTTLKNQLKGNRIGHAYLFCGTRGTGKTTVAKIFARAVNCLNPGPDGPCGECEMCRAIASQSSMNVIEIDAASNNGVDDARQLIEEVRYSPAEGKYKVYIIDEVHMLTTQAFNALLKTLEEPPSYMIFILATTEAHVIPLTIRSRCQRYDFRRISIETICDRLRELLDKEGMQAEERALQYIARQADGALRDALSLLEQCISFYFREELTYEKVIKVLGAVNYTVYHDLMRALADCDAELAIRITGEVIDEGKDLTQFASEFVWYLRNLIVIKTTDNTGNLVDVTEENLQKMKSFAGQVDAELLFRDIRIFSELAKEMRYSSNKRVIFEVAVIRLCRPQMQQDYDSLITRMRNLEQQYEKLQEYIASGNLVSSAALPAGSAHPAGAAVPAGSAGAAGPAVPAGSAATAGAAGLTATAGPAVLAGAGNTGSAGQTAQSALRPEAVPGDIQSVIQNWKQIEVRLGPVMRKMLEDAILSVSDSGALLIVFSQSTQADYFKKESSRNQLVEMAGQVTGKEIRVEIKYIKSNSERDAIPELRNILNNKVPFEVID